MFTSYRQLVRPRDRRGAVCVLVAVVLVVLMSVAALSIDGGQLYQTRRKMQTAADSASEAGAIELFTRYESNRGVDSDGEARASALSLASSHGYGVSGSGSTVVINIPPGSGAFRGTAGYVEAIITSRMPPTFSSIFGRSELMVVTRSVAGGTMIPSKAGLLILEPKRKDALKLKSKSASLAVDGDIIVNSSDKKKAVKVGKKSQIKADHLLVTGGIEKKSKQWIDAEVHTGVAPTPDPWASLPTPPKGPTRNTNDYETLVGGRTYFDLQPGTYKSLKFDKNEVINMAPGTYYIDGDGFELKGSTELTALGVTIFNTGKKGMKFRTSGNITVTPPSSGTYAGISLFQDRTKKAKVEFKRAHLNISGIVYAPTAQVKFNETEGDFDEGDADDDDDTEVEDDEMEDDTTPPLEGSLPAAIVARKMSIGKRSHITIHGTDINSLRPLLGVVE